MIHSKADQFFNEQEKETIRQTTADVESRTAGEVAVVVTDRSDAYHDGEIVGAAVSGSLLSMIITEVFFHASMWSFIPLSFIFFHFARRIFREYPDLRALFLGPRRKAHAVRHRAVRVFHEKGLNRTKDHTGVLFFISLLERKVWVLADKGIHEKITQETLDGYALSVSQGIREGRASEALCQAIRDVGKILAENFPVKPGDINELQDGVMSD